MQITWINCADDEVIITECCDAQIPIDQRYCPKCGYECRIHTRKTE